MKTKDVIVYSLIFLACVGLTAEVVVLQLTGHHLFASKSTPVAEQMPVACTDKPQTQRPATNDPQLKAVAEYEKICKSSFVENMMLFTNMPISEENAREQADAMATRLKEFDKFDIEPVVIAEPDSEWGLVDFHEFAGGDYDQWINAYFKRLKENGVTDQQMGMWVPFPEPQQPFWNNNGDPDDFARSINRYFKIVRAYFPQARTAILLDSQVGSGEASQLVAYTRLIEPKLVDVVGLQGFPWHPSDAGDTREPVLSASQFAPAYMVEEVAKSLDVKDVFINTGSYRHRKAQNGGETSVPTEQRKSTLDSVVYEAKLLKDAGYHVTVSIFAENKLDAKEGVDWSYWKQGVGTEVSETHAPLFTRFVKGLADNGVSIGLYDSRQ